MQTDQNPVPNCPGLRPEQFGTGFWPVPIRYAPDGRQLVESTRQMGANYCRVAGAGVFPERMRPCYRSKHGFQESSFSTPKQQQNPPQKWSLRHSGAQGLNLGWILVRRARGAGRKQRFLSKAVVAGGGEFFVRPSSFSRMAGGPRSRPWGVDSGPGEGSSEGVRGAPEPYKNIYFIAVQTSTTYSWARGLLQGGLGVCGRREAGPKIRGDAPSCTLCYAIVFPDRKSGFRAGFRPDSSRESFKIGPPAAQLGRQEPASRRPPLGA